MALVGALTLGSMTRLARAADPDPDPWLGKDKALHFSVSAVIAAGSYAAGTAIFDARGHALVAAGGLTLAVGAGKELLDLAGYGDPSWRDFAADVAGTIVGLAVAWSLDLLVRGIDDRSQPILSTPHDNGARSSTLRQPTRGLAFAF